MKKLGGMSRMTEEHDITINELAIQDAITKTGDDIIIVFCPYCDGGIEVLKKELNCCIFRHGVFKSSMLPMNPHTPQEECERLVDQIIGCSKPFRIDNENGVWVARVCGYI